MIRFLKELKRRKVIRVGSAYVAVGWGVTQLVSEFGDSLGLPDWVPTAFIVLVLAGLPIAMVLAWAFEITPDGEAVAAAGAEGASLPRLQVVDFALLGAMIAVTTIVAMGLIRGDTVAPALQDTAGAEPSIAVLPFADMSDTGDQAYFSDGLAEEVLNVLAQVQGLKVASRTSSFSFKDSGKNVTEIAALLGVAHVLDGSVRKSGTTLRITAQLIRAEDGFNVWSATYERELDDVFAIQDDVSNQILRELEVRVLGDTPQVAVERSDISAFDLVLRARDVGADYSIEGHERAAALYREAIGIDPEYAAAYFGLTAVILLNSDASGAQGERLAADALAEAWPILERGRELAPDDPRGWRQLGLFRHFSGEFAAAETAYKRAVELQPNIGRNNYSVLLNQQGRLREAIAVLEDEVKLNPAVLAPRANLLFCYLAANRMEDALQMVTAVERDFPDDTGLFSAKSARAAYLQAVGEWAESVRVLTEANDESPGVLPILFSLGTQLLDLQEHRGAMALGDPLVLAGAEALAGQPEAPMRMFVGLIDQGTRNPRLHGGAIFMAGLARRWDIVADKLVPSFPGPGSQPACVHQWFPHDIVALAYFNLGRDLALERLLDCWEGYLLDRRENGYDRASDLMSLGMWHWFDGDKDASYASLGLAVDRFLAAPALGFKMSEIGMLADPRGVDILERHYRFINRERAKLDLEPVSPQIFIGGTSD